MPIFCSNVNRASDGKLVPITCHNDASIGPDNLVIALKLVERSPENGPFWERVAENSLHAASEGEPSVKIVTSDVYSRDGF